MVDRIDDIQDPKEPVTTAEESEIEFDEIVCAAEFVCGCTETVKEMNDK